MLNHEHPPATPSASETASAVSSTAPYTLNSTAAKPAEERARTGDSVTFTGQYSTGGSRQGLRPAAAHSLAVLSADSDLDDVVPRALRGEQAAWRIVMDVVRKSARCAAARIDGSRADEVADEVVLVAVMRLHELRDPRALAAWAHRVGRRRAVNFASRLREELVAPEELPALEYVADAEYEPRLADAVARLPPLQREAVLRRVVEGATWAEIAESQSAPVETVRSRHRLGLEALRRALGLST